jgi:UDP-3-O-[3-hydroxymyristoyl] N-acetylglucosamine deacetylase
MTFQRTIERAAELSGAGVHSGKAVRMRLLPSDSGSILFRRTDLGGLEMALSSDTVESRNSTTLVGDAFRVRTVEHLMAVLFAFGLGSLVVELDADELPIMDGSAQPFADAVAAAGTRILGRGIEPLVVRTPFSVEEGGASVVFEPPAGGDSGLVLSYTIAYEHPAIGEQSREIRLDPETFAREIAPARTFGFLRDVESLRRQGLALGASMDNTVVLDETAVVNGPLRFPDEFIRHKLVDLAGDLALIGRPLRGRVAARKAGHKLHLRAVRRLLGLEGVRPGE